MTQHKTYRASVERDGAWWYVFVDDLGHSTQARRLEQVEGMVRDLVALAEGVPSDSFEVSMQVRLGSLDAVLREAREARNAAEKSQERAVDATRVAALALREDGLPMRDIGNLLGLTHQRISQLVAIKDEEQHTRP